MNTRRSTALAATITLALSFSVGGTATIAAGAAEASTPMCHGKKATIVIGEASDAEEHGTSGDDVIVITSTSSAYQVDGREGNDTICDMGRINFVLGGTGNDRISAGNGGHDRVFGQGGTDTCSAEFENTCEK